MSHIVSIKTQVRDEVAVQAACRRLHLQPAEQEEFELFRTRAIGLAVRLHSWIYPVVCDLHAGELQYDNFEGHWGEQRYLDQFLQAYAVEKTLLEARRQGYTAFEQPLENGSIRIQIQTN